MKEPVQFYLPRVHWPCNPLPTKADNPLHYPEGILTHTLQTYLQLKNAGYPCKLVDKLPRSGLVVSHRSLIARARFSPDLFLVNMLADRGPHYWAQAVVVQNPIQAERPGQSLIPQWPQPGLIPRDPCRGDRFEVVAYFGRSQNTDPELLEDAWAVRLRELGLSWRIVGHPRHDYHDVDAVVAVRDFSTPKACNFKPAAKLVNAWLAGAVPFAAPEPAHLAMRNSDLDYVPVSSADELYEALVRLRDNPELRRKMIINGLKRGRDFTSEKVSQRWQTFLDEVAWPAYRDWLRLSRTARWRYYLKCCALWPVDLHQRGRIKVDWSRFAR